MSSAALKTDLYRPASDRHSPSTEPETPSAQENRSKEKSLYIKPRCVCKLLSFMKHIINKQETISLASSQQYKQIHQMCVTSCFLKQKTNSKSNRTIAFCVSNCFLPLFLGCMQVCIGPPIKSVFSSGNM